MNDITELALITKIKNQLKNFDTVVLKEGEALALVEALENSESRLHEVAVACATAEQALEKAQRANAAQDDHINQQADRIESLEKKNGELGRRLYQYSMEPGEAEKRIAELEARQVDLEHIGYIQVEEGTFYLDESMVKSAICAAGIRINGED